MTPPTPHVIDLRVHGDDRGRLVALQQGDGALDFEVARVYWIYGVPSDESRGAHAHHATRQLMVALSGGLDMVFDNGFGTARVRLEAPSRALVIPAMEWHVMENVSPGTVAMVLASQPYEESDYIRDYESFLALTRRPEDDGATR